MAQRQRLDRRRLLRIDGGSSGGTRLAAEIAMAGAALSIVAVAALSFCSFVAGVAVVEINFS